MSTLASARRVRNPRHPARWAVYAAPKVGLLPESVEALAKGRCVIAERFAALVEAAVVLGDRRLLDKLMAPVDAAMARLPQEVLTPVLIRDVQAADLAEDAAEAIYHATPTSQVRHDWIHALRAQRATSLRLLMALEAV